MLAERTTETV